MPFASQVMILLRLLLGQGACLLMSQEGVAYLPSLHRVMHIDGGNAGRLRVHLNIDAGGKA
jgi:hypothetical protein